MEKIQDFSIIGAGPAGAYCALELSKQGVYPLIIDHSHPREKPCGGGISPEIIDKFPFVEKFRPMGFTFNKFRMITCTNLELYTNQLKNGFSISRKYFDKEILKMATQKGAKIIKEKVIDIEKRTKYWKIKTNKRIISTKVVVGADGVSSLVRFRTVGSIPKGHLALTYGYLANSIEKEQATIKYPVEIPGYIWVFPWKNCYNLGIGSELHNGGKIRSILNVFARKYCPSISIISRYAAMIPSANHPEFFKIPCAGKNWILIGDAAGHADPISGGGILYALWDGKLAAEAIKDHNPKSYDEKWRSKFGKNLVDQCKKKDGFYNPINSTISLLANHIRSS